MNYFACLPAGLSRWHRFRELANSHPELRSDAWAIWMFLFASAADETTQGDLVFLRDIGAIMDADRAAAAVAALVAHDMVEEREGAICLPEDAQPILLPAEDVFCCAGQR